MCGQMMAPTGVLLGRSIEGHGIGSPLYLLLWLYLCVYKTGYLCVVLAGLYLCVHKTGYLCVVLAGLELLI